MVVMPRSKETRESEQDLENRVDYTAENKQLTTREDPDAGQNEDFSVSRTPTTRRDKTSINSVGTLPENSQSDKQVVEISPITSEMLIPKYSEGEREAFLFLETRATGSRKLPREWKRLLNYHRLAWNILSKSRDVKTLAGWQVQLIAWVFVCWQWKDPINTLIQNWGDLGVLKNWITVNDDEQGKMAQKNTGPSLREIVEHYIEERLGRKGKTRESDRQSLEINVAKEGNSVHKVANTVYKNKLETKYSRKMSEKEVENGDTRDEEAIRNVGEEERENNSFEECNEPQDEAESERSWSNMERKHRDYFLETLKTELLQDNNWLRKIGRKVLQEENQRDQGEQSRRLKRKSTQRTEVAKTEEEDGEEWRKLRETLTQFNVSMDGIQAFQKFRFYCDAGHLPWPLSTTQQMC